MPEPTKADLKAAVTKLTEENAALYDIFAAAREAADAGTDYPWIIGYIGNVGQPCDRGNIQILRVLAAGVRRGPGRTAPVITDSGRTCDQANPGTGAWCHRDGDHGEHRDTNGETWRTDGGKAVADPAEMVEFTSDSRLTVTARCSQPAWHNPSVADRSVFCDRPEHHAPADVTSDKGRCECSHPKDMHADAAGDGTPCLRGGCGCTVFRPAAPSPHGELPAVVNGDVVLEVRALLS